MVRHESTCNLVDFIIYSPFPRENSPEPSTATIRLDKSSANHGPYFVHVPKDAAITRDDFAVDAQARLNVGPRREEKPVPLSTQCPFEAVARTALPRLPAATVTRAREVCKRGKKCGTGFVELEALGFEPASRWQHHYRTSKAVSANAVDLKASGCHYTLTAAPSRVVSPAAVPLLSAVLVRNLKRYRIRSWIEPLFPTTVFRCIRPIASCLLSVCFPPALRRECRFPLDARCSPT